MHRNIDQRAICVSGAERYNLCVVRRNGDGFVKRMFVVQAYATSTNQNEK